MDVCLLWVFRVVR